MSARPTLPAPLVPPEVDLRDFGFMPLEVVRLRDSDLAALAAPAEFKAAVLLWCASWHQVPAGSLPADDRLLWKYAGSEGPDAWAAVKEGALRGFVRCSDGRLYHPVVAQRALIAWEEKLARLARTRAATEAKRRKAGGSDAGGNGGGGGDRDDHRDGQRHDVRNGQRHELRNDQRDDDRDDHREQLPKGREGKGREVKGEEYHPPAPPASHASAREPEPDVHGKTLPGTPTPAGAACLAMRRAGLTSTNPGDPRLHALLEAGITSQTLAELAAEAVRARKANAWAWVLAVAKGRLDDAAAIRQQAADTQAAAEDPLTWGRDEVQSWANRLGMEPWDETEAHLGRMPPWPTFKQRVIDAYLNRRQH